MSTPKTSPLRRRMLGAAALAVGTLPLAGLWPLMTDGAESGAEKLDENSPEAANLGYRHDAAQVDTAKFPKRAGEAAATQFCKTCQFFAGGDTEEWGSCIIFQGRLVNAGGWCNSWFKRA